MNALDTYNLLQQSCEHNNPQQLSALINTIDDWDAFCKTVNTQLGKNMFAPVPLPLEYATQAGHLECVKAFEPVANVSYWNAVFEKAFEHNHSHILKYVLPKTHPQFLEDWSCARATFGDLHAIETTLPYLSEDGFQAIAYYAASHHEDEVFDFIAQHTDVDKTLDWMLKEENPSTNEQDQWICNKQSQLQRRRIEQHLTTQPARAIRKI